MFLPPCSPFISSSTRLLPHSVTADAVQSGSRITPSSQSMETVHEPTELPSPTLFPVSTTSLLDFRKQKVQSAKNTEIKSGRVYQSASCPMPHSWDLNILVSFTNSVVCFFFFTCNALMVSTCNSKHFATRVQEKETKKLGRVGKEDIIFFQKYIVFYGIQQEQVKEICCTMLHGLFLKWTCM